MHGLTIYFSIALIITRVSGKYWRSVNSCFL